MRRISTAGALTVVLAAGAGPGAGVTLHAQPPSRSPLAPAARPETAPTDPHRARRRERAPSRASPSPCHASVSHRRHEP